MRGLAILMVLVLHFIGNAHATDRVEWVVKWVASYGMYGVDLFFVLSGFLITGVLHDARHAPLFFPVFYVRRLLRIFPLYYGVLVAVFLGAPLLPALRGPALDLLLERQAWAWMYAVNLLIGVEGRYSLPYLDHFWSLAVEEHFYLVWPFAVWALRDRPRGLMAASLGLAGAAVAARLAASVAHVPPVTIFVLTPFRLDALGLGAFLALLAREKGGLEYMGRALRPVALAAGSTLLLSFGVSRLTPAAYDLLHSTRGVLILVLLAALLLRAVLAAPGSLWFRAFTHPAMMALGKYSYGVYVFHHFLSYHFATRGTEFALARVLGSHKIAVLVQAAGGATASVAMAWASYHLFERRFLGLKDRLVPRQVSGQEPPGLVPGRPS